MPASITGSTLDLPITRELAWNTYRYAGLLDQERTALDDTNRSFAATLGLPFTQMAYAYEVLGDYEQTVANLERAAALSPNPAVSAALQELRFRGPPRGDEPAARLP
jgi:tetratricopeptide (TPR) repeat protein